MDLAGLRGREVHRFLGLRKTVEVLLSEAISQVSPHGFLVERKFLHLGERVSVGEGDHVGNAKVATLGASPLGLGATSSDHQRVCFAAFGIGNVEHRNWNSTLCHRRK